MRGRKGFAKAVKSVILKTAEKKYRSVDSKQFYIWNGTTYVGPTIDLFGQIGVSHNAPFQFNILNNSGPNTSDHPLPVQGDGDGNRNGDEIYGKGFMLRIMCENDAGRHNNTWKFWLVEHNTVQGVPCVPSDFFHVVTGNTLIDSIQTDRWKARLLGSFRTRSRDVDPNSKTNVFIKKWIPFRRKLCFKSDDSIVITKGMKEVFSLVGVCYDTSNTIFNVALGNIRLSTTFYYADP